MILKDKYLVNFSQYKEIDKRFFNFRISLVFFISLILILASIFLMFNKSKAENKKINEIREIENKIEKIELNKKDMEEKLKYLKSKWKNDVKLVNLLMEKKSFDYIMILNKLENIIPISCYINELSISNSKKLFVEISVIARSFTDLLSLYRSLAKYKYNIKSEIKGNNVYNVKLELFFKNEKK